MAWKFDAKLTCPLLSDAWLLLASDPGATGGNRPNSSGIGDVASTLWG